MSSPNCSVGFAARLCVGSVPPLFFTPRQDDLLADPLGAHEEVGDTLGGHLRGSVKNG